jgi:hypothetical protein
MSEETKEGMQEPTNPELDKTSINNDKEGTQDAKVNEPEDLKAETLLAQKEHWRNKAKDTAKELEAKNIEIERLKKLALENNPKEQFIEQERELSNKYGDWEIKSEAEREALRIAYQAKREVEILKKTQEEINKSKEFNSEVLECAKKFNFNPDEFQAFIKQEEYEGSPLHVLAELFSSKNTGKPQRQGLEPASGGTRNVDTRDGITIDEVSKLMSTNPKQYFELQRAGRIKIKE